MPNPLDQANSAYDKYAQWFQKPLLPQSAIQGLQDSLTEPKLDQSPLMAQVKGFGAGALDGIRNLTSPGDLLALTGLASAAVGPRPPQGPVVEPFPTRSAFPVQETLGERPGFGEFTSVGGEHMHNPAIAQERGAGGPGVDPLVQKYQEKWGGILPKGAR
jgi:hypothetical protein